MAADPPLAERMPEEVEDRLLEAQDAMFEHRLEDAADTLQGIADKGYMLNDVMSMLWECRTQLLQDSAALDTALDLGVHSGSSAAQLGMLLVSAASIGSTPILSGIIDSMCKVEVTDATFALARAALADSSCPLWTEPVSPEVGTCVAKILLSQSRPTQTASVSKPGADSIDDGAVYDAWRRWCRDATTDLKLATKHFAEQALGGCGSELALAFAAILLCTLLPREGASDAWEALVATALLPDQQGVACAAVRALLAADSAKCKHFASLGGFAFSPLLRQRLLRQAGVVMDRPGGHDAADAAGVVETDLS